MSRTPDPADAIRLRSGLPRWRNRVLTNAVVLATAILATWSIYGCFR